MTAQHKAPDLACNPGRFPCLAVHLCVTGVHFQLPNNPFSSARKRPPVPRLVLYRGAGMTAFRLIVRAKVFQLVGAFTITMLVSAMLTAVSSQAYALYLLGGCA